MAGRAGVRVSACFEHLHNMLRHAKAWTPTRCRYLRNSAHFDNIAPATRVKPMIGSKVFDYRVQSVPYGKSRFGRMKSASEGPLDMKDFTPTPEPTNSPAQ